MISGSPLINPICSVAQFGRHGWSILSVVYFFRRRPEEDIVTSSMVSFCLWRWEEETIFQGKSHMDESKASAWELSKAARPWCNAQNITKARLPPGPMDHRENFEVSVSKGSHHRAHNGDVSWSIVMLAPSGNETNLSFFSNSSHKDSDNHKWLGTSCTEKLTARKHGPHIPRKSNFTREQKQVCQCDKK